MLLATRASLRSTGGLPVPSSGPFCGGPAPSEENAVPSELVPGVVGFVPAAPPVTEEWCMPKPPPIPPPMPPRAKAVGEQATHSATVKMWRLFMTRTSVCDPTIALEPRFPNPRDSDFSFRHKAALGYLQAQIEGSYSMRFLMATAITAAL